jgi:predicted transcriptional regulator
MNKPKPDIGSDADLGPLDANGQQIWSTEEEAAIARLHRDPAYWAGLRRAEADIAAGRMLTHEEVLEASAERRRQYLAKRAR